MAVRRKKKAARKAVSQTAKAFRALKKIDPTSVVREGEVASASNARRASAVARKAYNAALKIDAKSVVRESEVKKRKKRKK